MLYQTLKQRADADGEGVDPTQIYEGPADLSGDLAGADGRDHVGDLNAATLTPSSAVHAGAVHLGMTQGAITLTVTPKPDMIKADQFDAPVDATLGSITAKIEETWQSAMDSGARAGRGQRHSARNYAQCTFGRTNSASGDLHRGDLVEADGDDESGGGMPVPRECG